MINQTDHPVAWALLLYEIDDLKEHLDTLLKQMAADGQIDDEDYKVHVSHAYAHLNRIWNARNDGSEDKARDRITDFTKFPTDIEPVG
jgi:hypothetical protein